jgi:hypothetical protein
LWLRGKGEVAFDVLPLHNAHELPSRRRHHDTLRAVLSHMRSDVPK